MNSLLHLAASLRFELTRAKQDLINVIANECMGRKALLAFDFFLCIMSSEDCLYRTQRQKLSHVLAFVFFALISAASSQASPWTLQPSFPSPSPASSSTPQRLGRSDPAPPVSGPWVSP